MKILFNSYQEFIGTKKMYGGPRIFAGLLINFFKQHKIDYFGLILKNDTNLKKPFKFEKFPLSKMGLLKLNFSYKDFFTNRSPKTLKSLEKCIDITAQIIEQEQPDIVFLLGFSLMNWVILKAAKKAGTVVVVVHLGLWFKEMIYAKSLSKQALKQTREMEKDITRLADREIFLNNYSKRVYEKELIKTDPKKTLVIPLPYNPKYFGAKIIKCKPDGFLNIGTIGRWDPIKNPQAFFEIATRAKELKLKWKFSAVLEIGGRKSLSDLEEPFKKIIRVVTTMNDSNLKKFIGKMDLLLLPSIFDVNPNVVMEAILLGKMTMISPEVGWVSEYKDAGAANWITDFSDPDQVIKKIKKLGNRSVPKILYNKIRRSHDSAKILSQYMNVFYKLIKVN